jgi:hypothetical protein
MAFRKSMLAGIVAVVGAIIIAVLAIAVYLRWLAHRFRDSSGGSVAIDARSLLPILCVLVVIFAVGFWWQWRREGIRR